MAVCIEYLERCVFFFGVVEQQACMWVVTCADVANSGFGLTGVLDVSRHAG